MSDRQSADQLATDVVLLKAQVGAIEQEINHLGVKIDGFLGEYQKSRQWNLNIIAPLATIVTFASIILGLFVQSQTSPLNADLRSTIVALSTLTDRVKGDEDNMKGQDAQIARSATMDARREQDMGNVGQRLDRLTAISSDNGSQIRGILEKLCEVEVQFASDERDALTREQYQQRWNAIFYQILNKRDMPQLGPPLPGLASGKPCIVGKVE